MDTTEKHPAQKHFGDWALNFPEEFELVQEHESTNRYATAIAEVRHVATGETRFYPYHWSQQSGQVTWGKWFHGGRDLAAIAYVSRPYKTLAKAQAATY